MRTPWVVLTVLSAQVAQAAVHPTTTEQLVVTCLAPAVVGGLVWCARLYSRRRASLRRAQARALEEQAAALRALPNDKREDEARALELAAAQACADADAFEEAADALSDPGIARARGGPNG